MCCLEKEKKTNMECSGSSSLSASKGHHKADSDKYSLRPLE